MEIANRSQVDARLATRPVRTEQAPPLRTTAAGRASKGLPVPWFVAATWHLFCSPKTALLIILGLALATLAGTLILQAPDAVRSDPNSYFQWLEGTRSKYGVVLTQVFYRLDAFNAFGSFWFRGLVILVIINITVCTINRWKSTWHAITYLRVVMPASYYSGGGAFSLSAPEADLSPQSALHALAGILRRSHYRVVEARNGMLYLYSDRHRLTRLATYATHVSIILVLAGAIMGGLGFREDAFIVPEGSTKDLGHGTALSLKLEDFADEWYLNDMPKDYRSQVMLYDNGAEVARGTIRVNEPLEYQGVRFHQAFYGQSAVMEVRDKAGGLLFGDTVALPWRSAASAGENARPMGSFTVPGRDLTVYALLPSPEGDSAIQPGQIWLEGRSPGAARPVFMDILTVRQTRTIGDLQFTFVRERQFTGLSVVQDPGIPIVWIASFLLILGNALVLFFPPRQIWARSYADESGATRLQVRALATRDQGLQEELGRLQERLRRALPMSQTKDSPAPQMGTQERLAVAMGAGRAGRRMG